MLRALILALAVLTAAPAAAEPLLDDLGTFALDADRAVAVSGLTHNLGVATLVLEHGTLVPARTAGGRGGEVVFLGAGRLRMEPASAIERGQLELFTGGEDLDEAIDAAVLVLPDRAVLASLLRRSPAGADAPLQRAQAVYDAWRAGPVRRLVGAERILLGAALGDPLLRPGVVASLHGLELGDFLLMVDPTAEEQVTLEQFVPTELEDDERRRLQRLLEKEQRRGRMLGLSAGDAGTWDTWVSASLTAADGQQVRGRAPFDATAHRIDLSLLAEDADLAARAQVELTAAVGGTRLVPLTLSSDLVVEGVRDGAGSDLPFLRTGSDLWVVLESAPARGETVVLEVAYAGALLFEGRRTWVLRDTLGWHPRVETSAQATYDVTLHLPRRLQVMGSGRVVEDVAESADMRRERRVLERPSGGFSFQIGRFEVEERQAGEVAVTVAFDRDGRRLSKDERTEIVDTVVDSLTYFEELFGPYPMERLTVVTGPGDFSQAHLGFITLADSMIESSWLHSLLGFEDPRTVVAHEVAHQWWGHLILWSSYRDQWISEAMANYAAVLYARNRLEWERGRRGGPTSDWFGELSSTTTDGRPIESLGPLVLGVRLSSSRSSDAYTAIVYKKGAVVLQMLEATLGRERFLEGLGQLARAAADRELSTAAFIATLERLGGIDLEVFAEQYVYGTGIPEVLYDYRFDRGEDGGWVIRGTAQRRQPQRFSYRVVALPGGGFDVVRTREPLGAPRTWRMVVPIQVGALDPDRSTASDSGRREARRRREHEADWGNVVIDGWLFLNAASDGFEIPVQYEPKVMWFDRHREVLGDFADARRNPKLTRYVEGMESLADGRLEAAQAALEAARTASFRSGPELEGDLLDEIRELQEEVLGARVELGLARLALERGGSLEQAEAALAAAEDRLSRRARWAVEGELLLLEARLDLARGNPESAFRTLRRQVLKREDLTSAEAYALLAIAAHLTRHDEEYRIAREAAIEQGADLSALDAG